MQKIYKRNIILTVLVTTISCIIAAVVTYAWLGRTIRVGATNAISSASGSVSEYVCGHDTFMWDMESGKGIRKNEDTVVMNTYDTVFTKNNDRTPIILRAVLSSDWAEVADSVTLNLTSVPISNMISQMGSGTDTFKMVASGSGYIHYLSNVINVRAAYIPGLVTNAENGNYSSTTYKTEDDYIYQYAVSYFNNNADIVPVTFVHSGIATKTVETPVTTTYYKVTKISSTGDLTTSAVSSSGTNDDAAIVGYLIGYGDSTFLALDSSGAISSVTSSNVDTVNSYTEAAWNNTSFSNILWTQSASTKALATTTTLYQNGYYLYSDKGKLSGSSTAQNWNISYIDNAKRICIYNSNGNNSSYLQYQSDNRGSRWEANPNSSNANITLYKVERYTVTKNISQDVAVTSYNNVISIDVELNDASREEIDGNYYVYLMIDYNADLVKEYFTYNKLTFALGSISGHPFTDTLNITPATPTPSA